MDNRPIEPGDTPNPAAYSGTAPAKPAGDQGSAKTLRSVFMAAAITALFVWVRGRLPEAGPVPAARPSVPAEAPAQAASPAISVEPPARQAPAAAQAPAEPSPLADVEKKIAEIERPTLDLEARMWAYRIQEGEFTEETLKGYSGNWIATEEYKTSLFAKIDGLLKAGPVTPLTKKENAALDEAKEKARQLLKKP